MVHMTQGGSPKLPVEKLAEFLLNCAKEDPALLARSNVDPIAGSIRAPIGGHDSRARSPLPRGPAVRASP